MEFSAISAGRIRRQLQHPGPRVGELRVTLEKLPVGKERLGGRGILDQMTDIGLAEKARGREVGRAGPHADRLATTLEPNDELVVRDLGLGAGIKNTPVVERQASLLDRALVRALLLFRGRGGVVIDDADIDAPPERALELFEHRLISELVGRYSQSVPARRLPDEPQTGVEQAARQPARLRIVGIIDLVLGRGPVLELSCERLAGNGAAVEPHAVAVRELLLGANFELDPGLRLERAGLAVHGNDRELVTGVGLRRVIAPQEALDRVLGGVIALGLRRILGVALGAGIGHDRTKHLLCAQPLCFAGVSGTLALEGETEKSLASLLLAVERDQDRVGSRDRLGAKVALTLHDAHGDPLGIGTVKGSINDVGCERSDKPR